MLILCILRVKTIRCFCLLKSNNMQGKYGRGHPVLIVCCETLKGMEKTVFAALFVSFVYGAYSSSRWLDNLSVKNEPA